MPRQWIPKPYAVSQSDVIGPDVCALTSHLRRIAAEQSIALVNPTTSQNESCTAAGVEVGTSLDQSARQAVLIDLVQEHYDAALADALPHGLFTTWDYVESSMKEHSGHFVRRAVNAHPHLAARLLMSPATAYALNKRLLLEMLELPIGHNKGELLLPLPSRQYISSFDRSAAIE